MNGILLFIFGAALSSVATHTYMTNSGEPLKYPLEVKLHRFELQDDAEQPLVEWIKWHDEEHGPIIETLERERMYFEAVFRDPEKKQNAIYWLEIRGKGGHSASSSPHPIDQVHLDYMSRIRKPGTRTTAEAEYILTPDFIEDAIREHQNK